MTDVKSIDLSKPIIGGDGKEMNAIKVNPITTVMYFKHGDLMRSEVRTNGNTETIFVTTDMDALKGYIADCTNLPSPIVNLLAPRDLMKVKAVVEGFFHDFQ